MEKSQLEGHKGLMDQDQDYYELIGQKELANKIKSFKICFGEQLLSHKTKLDIAFRDVPKGTESHRCDTYSGYCNNILSFKKSIEERCQGKHSLRNGFLQQSRFSRQDHEAFRYLCHPSSPRVGTVEPSPWYFLILAALTATIDDPESAMNWLGCGLRSYPHETNLNRFMGYLLIRYHSDFQTGVAHFHHALRTTLANLHEIEINKSLLIENDIHALLNKRYTKAKHKIIRELAYYVALSPVPLPGSEILVSQKDVEEWLKPRFPELLKDNALCLASDSANLIRFDLLSMEDVVRFRHQVATALMGRRASGDTKNKKVIDWINVPENKKEVNNWLSYYTGDLFLDSDEPYRLNEESHDKADCRSVKDKYKVLIHAQDRPLLTDLLAILRAGARQDLVKRAGLKEAERLMYSITSPLLQTDSTDRLETARVYGLVLLVRNGEYECPKRGKAISAALRLFRGARDELKIELARARTEDRLEDYHAKYYLENEKLDLYLTAARDLACPDNAKGESAMEVPYIN